MAFYGQRWVTSDQSGPTKPMIPATESVPPLPELATKRQVAAWAQVSPSTIKRMVARNEIPHCRVGRQLRFPGAAIRSFFSLQNGGA